MRREWASVEDARIGAIFEQAAAGVQDSHAGSAKVLAAARADIEWLPQCVSDVFTGLHPNTSEVDALRKELNASGSDYWHLLNHLRPYDADEEPARDFKRLRGWRYQVNRNVQAHLKTPGFTDL